MYVNFMAIENSASLVRTRLCVIENIANGILKTDGVVGHCFKLEDWEKAFDYATGKYGDLKIAFTF